MSLTEWRWCFDSLLVRDKTRDGGQRAKNHMQPIADGADGIDADAGEVGEVWKFDTLWEHPFG